MSDAPKRIWVENEFSVEDDEWSYGVWDCRESYLNYEVEYIRADIVDALVAALNEINLRGVGDIATDALSVYKRVTK